MSSSIWNVKQIIINTPYLFVLYSWSLWGFSNTPTYTRTHSIIIRTVTVCARLEKTLQKGWFQEYYYYYCRSLTFYRTINWNYKLRGKTYKVTHMYSSFWSYVHAYLSAVHNMSHFIYFDSCHFNHLGTFILWTRMGLLFSWLDYTVYSQKWIEHCVWLSQGQDWFPVKAINFFNCL